MADGNRLSERLIRALRLELALYEEVSADAAATGQAFVVVLLSGLANGLGLVSRLGGSSISAGVGAGVLGWFLWTAVVLLIGALFGRRRSGRSLFRALGFATAPGLVLIVGMVPLIGALARVVAVCWLVAATAVAVQAVYDMSRRRAVLVSLIAFVLYLLLGVAATLVANS